MDHGTRQRGVKVVGLLAMIRARAANRAVEIGRAARFGPRVHCGAAPDRESSSAGAEIGAGMTIVTTGAGAALVIRASTFHRGNCIVAASIAWRSALTRCLPSLEHPRPRTTIRHTPRAGHTPAQLQHVGERV
jgi:hypothetical protein